jgi:biofilm PGA synthesis N-glycosyltransferase PgaC
MEVFWWILLFIVFYAYLGYGILLLVLVRIKGIFTATPSYNKEFLPAVTLVIPAYNEADVIRQKAMNCLELDYPKERLRILFITDGSSDDTPTILNSMEGIEVTHNNRRAGKSAAENRAMTLVNTPIVVFCDANTMLNTSAIRELVKFYEDPKVGGVAGEKRVITGNSDNAGSGEGFYWKYESKLKKWDSELYTVVGAAGELISFRSELMTELEEDTILDDFMQSLRICEKGYTVKYEPAAVAMETASETAGEELKRKIRIAAGGWQSMSRLPRLLNPFRNPLLTFQYVSHRVLRWSVAAFALPLILILNIIIVLLGAPWIYNLALVFQTIFYSLALIGWALENRQLKFKLFFIPYYFCMMNYAVFAGFFRWIRGSQKATWEKARRAAV